MNGYENIDRNILVSIKEQCRLNIRKFPFSQRTVNADYVGASSVNMFKNKIDMYLRRAGYI